MVTDSRTSKSIKNSLVALAFYFINLVLQFFSRKVFLDYLGAEILGLNTTATNLLQFLNLAELGIGSAIACTLYKPLLEKDTVAINEIVSLQGWLYRRIAWIVIVGSLVLMAFFPWIFAKMPLPLWYAYASFGVLLVSALLSYFVNYKQIVLSADQKELFNQRFAQLFSHAGYAYGGSMRSAVARIAINTCRILSIVALLRALEKFLPPQQKIFNSQFSIFNSPGLSPAPEIPIENIKDGIVPKLDLRVTDEDFQAVLTLIEPLYRHSSYVLGFLPTSEAIPVQTSPEQALFNAFPMMFCRRQAVEEAAKNGIPEKTLDSSLKRMLEKGTLIKTARGEYAFSSHVCVREGRPKE